MPTGSKEKTKAAESQLEELAQELREHGATDVSYRVPIGTPYEEILKAGGNRADAFVVMGTHGLAFLPGVVLGSVGRHVVSSRRSSGSSPPRIGVGGLIAELETSRRCPSGYLYSSTS